MKQAQRNIELIRRESKQNLRVSVKQIGKVFATYARLPRNVFSRKDD